MAEFENTNNMSGDQIDRALSDLIQKGDRAFDKFNRIMDNELNNQTQSAGQRAQRETYADVRRQEAQIKKETGFSRETFIQASNGDEDEAQKMADTARAKKQERELARLNKTLGIDDSSMKRAEAKQKAVSAETKELQSMGAMLGKVTRLLQIFGIALGIKAWVDRPKQDTESYTSAFQAGLSHTGRRAYELTARQLGINEGTFISGQRVANDMYARLKQGQIDERYTKLLGFGQQYGLKLPQIQDVSNMTPQEFFMQIMGGFEEALRKGLKEDDINSLRTLFNDFFGSDDITSAIGIAFQNGFSVIERIMENQSVIENPHDYSKTMLDFNKEWEEFKARVLNQLMAVAERLAEFAIPLVDFLNRWSALSTDVEKKNNTKHALSTYEKAMSIENLTSEEKEFYFDNFYTGLLETYASSKFSPPHALLARLVNEFFDARKNGNVEMQKYTQDSLRYLLGNEKFRESVKNFLKGRAVESGVSKEAGALVGDTGIVPEASLEQIIDEIIFNTKLEDNITDKNLFYNDEAQDTNSTKKQGGKNNNIILNNKDGILIPNDNKDGIQIQSSLNLDKLQVNETPNLTILSNNNNGALLAQVDVLLNINNNSNDVLEYNVTSKSDSINAVTINEGYGIYG